jgi:ABC-type Mn2+/Zn2+ transport system permease subunit
MIFAPLSGDFGLSSAVELALVGGACGAVGVWVVQFGRAFLAESFTHALLPGLVLAAITGSGLFLGAVVGIVFAYAVLLAAQRAPRTAPSSATSVTVTLLVAVGALMASGGTGAARFESLLFGDPLAASTRDIVVACGLALAISVTMFLYHHRFSAIVFDPGAAPSLGVNVAVTGAILLALLVLSIAVAANVAGSLLALALITGPGIGALALTDRISHAIAVAAVAGALCGLAGIYLSYYADWPASACIAIAASVFAAGGIGLAPFRAAARGSRRPVAKPETA